MKTSSCKNKARVLQNLVRDKILAMFPLLEPDDVQSRSMGAPGEDIMLSPAARRCFPFSVECKNVEKLNVWAAFIQAKANAGKHTPILIMKKNRQTPLVVIELDSFMSLVGRAGYDR